MNCFDVLCRDLSLNESSQGDFAAIHALAQMSSAGYTPGDTYAAAAQECLYRWRNCNPHFLAMASQRLNSLLEKESR